MSDSYNTRAGWQTPEPKFHASNASPGFFDAVVGFGVKDIAIVGASTAFAGTAGYFGATKHALRGPTARIAMVIGASGGFLLACQNSWGRLMGYTE